MSRNFVFIFLLLLTTCADAQQPTLSFGKLTCEYIVNPLGIDTKKPRFAWILESKRRNQFQSAYEIIVSDDVKRIKSGKGINWTSGKILSSQNTQQVYEGKPLRSNTKYYWRVKVYDAANRASAWSPVAWFETAMLDTSDWKAKWIG